MLVFLLYVVVLLNLFSLNVKGESIRDQFTSRFYERCSKYSFFDKFVQMLENPPNKYIIFEYHKTGLKNGGFGDRLGGVFTAFAHSLRFNRSLHMVASNGMHDLFRPFHPKFIPNPKNLSAIEREKGDDVYYWNRWGEWSGFDAWKREHPEYLEDPSDYEYDLSDCVDVSMGGFSEKKTKKCAMDTVSNQKLSKYPIIRFASNRAYLCRYENRTDLPSHKETSDALGLIPGEYDLFEVAGCISRMILWPTDRLWQLVDDTYTKHYRDLLTESSDDVIKLIDKERHPENYENDDDNENEVKQGKRKTKEEKKKWKKLVKKNSKKLKDFISLNVLINSTLPSSTKANDDLSDDSSSRSDDDSTSSESPSAVLPYTLQPNPPFQIGLHMRCGDYWSYRNLLLNTDGYHRTGCIYDEEDEKMDEFVPYTTDPTTAKRSYYLNGGNPKTLGMCVNHMIQHRKNLLEARNRKSSRRRFEVDPNGFFRYADHDDDIASEEGESVYVSNHTLVYVTADNLMAEYQMKQFANHFPTIISPQGCHIDLDQSSECYELTTVYWFMLSLSNLVISQTFGEKNAPTSSFSRYSGIYSLFPDSPFRTGRYCGDTVHSTSVLSRINQGNWYCQ